MGPSVQGWAWDELGHADLGDERRTRRLVRLTADLAARPGESIPDALVGWAELKAAYRFFDNGAIDPDAILAAHRDATVRRCAPLPRVLIVHDTSAFDFSTHRATTGLGFTTFDAPRGFFQHTALAVGADGVPLGILARRAWARKELRRLPETRRRNVPAREEESGRWIDVAREAARGLPEAVKVIDVADREADMHEFLEASRALGHDFLVRAVHKRKLASDDGTTVWEHVASLPN